MPQHRFKSLEEHNVSSFVTLILGSTLGTLVDYGLTDEEINDICRHLVAVTRTAKTNPEVIAAAKYFNNLLGGPIDAKT